MMAPDPALALCVLRSWAPRAARPGPNVRACTLGRSQDTGIQPGNYVSEKQGRAESKNAGPIWPRHWAGLLIIMNALPHEPSQASQATHWPLHSAGKLDICWEMNRSCVDIGTTDHTISMCLLFVWVRPLLFPSKIYLNPLVSQKASS